MIISTVLDRIPTFTIFVSYYPNAHSGLSAQQFCGLLL